MSNKADLEKVIAELKGSPLFDRFIKTLAARREFVVNQLINDISGNVDILRGEARAYDHIIKAATPRA